MTSVGLQQLDNGDVYSTNGTTNSSPPGSLGVTGCDSAEQITKLFPKCRPRSDVNLNPVVIVRTNTANDHEERSITRMLSPERALNSTPEPLITLQDLTDTNERSVSERSTNTECREKQGHDVEEDMEDEYDDDDDEDDDDEDGDDDDDDEEEEEDDDDDDEVNARGQGGVEANEPEVLSHGHVPDELSSEDGEQLNNRHKNTNQMIILTHNKGGTYRLRDSRVIEIAGGREIYSQSRMKAVRKARHLGDGGEKKAKGVWDVRSRCESKKYQNTRDTVTETVFSTEVCSVRHHRTGNNRGNVSGSSSSFRNNIDNVISPSRSMAVVSCGEVVVFDDIGDNWQGLRLDLCSDNSKTETNPRPDTESPQSYHQNNDLYKVITSVSDLEGDSLSPEPNAQVAQVIGNLPIAVYEGSPRRYGPRQMDGTQVSSHSTTHPSLPSAHSLLASPSVYPPRPGFPQRIVTTPSDDKLDSTNSTCENSDPMQPVSSTFDYLYEFSETRKVLEEFFKCPPDDENHLLESEFQDLDYELHRQAGGVDSGNSYVGQRLAKIRSEQNEYLARHLESPPRKTTPVSNEFNRMPEHEVIEHENNFLDLSVGTGSSGDLGETEVGLQVGHSRNFTLSPETTDCDSNCGDLDSEMSLMLMENELGPSSVDLLGSSGDLVAPTDSLRLYSSMPVLEDGLSSGHTSDTDNNNPTVLLMKRQITEIEREIIQGSHINDSNVVAGKLPDSEAKDSLETKSPIEILIGNDASINTFQDNEHEIQNIDLLVSEVTPPSPAPAPNRRLSDTGVVGDESPNRVEAAIQDIRLALQRTKTLPLTIAEIPSPGSPPEPTLGSPVWIPRQRSLLRSSRDSESNDRKAQSGEEACDEEEADTDLETDRLLGQHRTDDQGFYDDKMEWRKPKTRTIMPSTLPSVALLTSKSASCSNNVTPTANPNSKTSGSGATKQILTLSPSVHQIASTNNNNNINSINNNCEEGATPKTTLATSLLSSPTVNKCANPLQSSTVTNNANSPGSASDKNMSPQSQNDGSNASSSKSKKDKENKKKGRNKEGLLRDPSVLIEGVLFRARYLGSTQLVCEGQPTKSTRMMQAEEAVSRIKEASNQIFQSYRQYGHSSMTSLGSYENETGMEDNNDDDENRDKHSCHNSPVPISSLKPTSVNSATYDDSIPILSSTIPDPTTPSSPRTASSSPLPTHLSQPYSMHQNHPMMTPQNAQNIPQLALGVNASGTVFRLQFLGSVEVDEEGGRKRRKRLKKNMVEEAVTKIKAPDGESQPSTEVDLFISTEKIMVLNTDLKEIMMDHALRTISYIADIGDLVVLMARRRLVPHEMEDPPKISRTPKMICHVFESEEAQFIAQSIGQAFQVAYMEFLKANGIEDHSFVKEMDYQEVLNSQEIFGDELQMFAKKEMQKEVVVPKSKGEILGVVIVESGWGSMLPTVVIANLAPVGAAARCGQLNIGDQIIAINGVSLVGLPLSTCQNYIKNSKNQTVVKLTVVPCAPVVEVKIKRPDTKYQLGFSVQNGVICSLLRGGIAERGGVRVGHRIIEINNQSVVAVPHEKIVNLLATSVGEILMKTMPTSMFRLLTGQENPVYI